MKKYVARLVELLIFVVAFAVISRPVLAQDNETCLSCHEDTELVGTDLDGNEASEFVSADSLAMSVHSDFDCIDCHTELDGYDDYPHDEQLPKVDCGSCHDEVTQEFLESAHGRAISQNKNAPKCTSCHGTHSILSEDNPQSMISPERVPYTCSQCHTDDKISNDPDIRMVSSFDAYMRGIHGRSVRKGLASSAACNDCHGTHDMKPASDPESRVNHKRLPETCSKCHYDMYIKYSRGIHGKALAAGITDSPNCSDCHGEHEILEPGSLGSPVNHSNQSDYVCGRCHNDPRLAEKYGLGSDRFTTYQDSYHGLAIKGGSVKSATCVSCHEAHDILPAQNPASSINPDNIVETCQQCHPQANATFAQSYTHSAYQPEQNVLDTTVQKIYIVLIIFVIGGMLFHNAVILIRYIVEKYRAQKNVETVKRFTGGMVFQHFLVSISFIVLVITGFALRYPDAWWVPALSVIGIHEAVRSTLHRIAAVALMYVSLHHIIFIVFTRRGHEELKAMLPRRSDLTEATQNIRHYLKGDVPAPAFGKYDYTEKAEYWALAWGTIIMVVTGLMLWFPEFTTSFLPAWTIKVGQTIHLYEAWLATLAIIVFHFFFVIFHPDRYPMSTTWLNGKITMKECKEHHPKWYEQMKTQNNNKNSGTSSSYHINSEK